MAEKKKNVKLLSSNQNQTPIPQFLSMDEMHEADSFKKQLIEEMYTTSFTEYQMKCQTTLINLIEDRQIEFSIVHKLQYGVYPEGSEEISLYQTKEEKNTHSSIDIGLDSWSELTIQIGLDDIIFKNSSTNKSDKRFLNKLLLVNNTKIDIIRELSVREIVKRKMLKPIPKVSTFKNVISELRKMFGEFFPNLDSEEFIEHKRNKNGYITPIAIEMLDKEEKVLNTKQRMQRNGDTNLYTYNKEYDEDIQADALQSHLRENHSISNDFMMENENEDRIGQYLEKNVYHNYDLEDE